MKRLIQFKRMFGVILLAGGISGFALAARAADAPRVFCDDPAVLTASKAALSGGDASLQPALKHLLADADKMLDEKPLSVMDKKQTPPSGDKHDFISQAPYFWKPTNSPGAKYVRRDGERNPEAGADSDSGRFQKICADAHTLALAWYFSGDEKYAAKSAELIRVWFLDPATHMNPNLNFGQGIPGEVEGRPAGLISARGLVHLVDAIGLLAGSKAWTAADQKGMTAWFTEYLHWLTTSKIGRGELDAKNNHGTYCDTQAAAIALFLGDTAAAKKIVTEAEEKRVTRQIEPDGSQPLELARTTSFGYSCFNLRALMDLSSIARKVGVDLWHYQTADGRSIQKATEYMAPYVDPAHKWPHQQIHAASQGDLHELLNRAAVEFPDSKVIHDALQGVKDDSSNPARLYFKTAAVVPAK